MPRNWTTALEYSSFLFVHFSDSRTDMDCLLFLLAKCVGLFVTSDIHLAFIVSWYKNSFVRDNWIELLLRRYAEQFRLATGLEVDLGHFICARYHSHAAKFMFDVLVNPSNSISLSLTTDDMRALPRVLRYLYSVIPSHQRDLCFSLYYTASSSNCYYLRHMLFHSILVQCKNTPFYLYDSGRIGILWHEGHPYFLGNRFGEIYDPHREVCDLY